VFPDGDCVTSPPAGKAVRFRDGLEDPSWDPLTFDMWLADEGPHGPMGHVHPEQVDRLTVRSGRLGLWLAVLPLWLQRAVIGLLAPLGRALSDDNKYPELLG